MTEPLRHPIDVDTLLSSQLWVGVHLDTPGVICPSCGQVACRRRRYLHHSMAAALLVAVRYTRTVSNAHWFHLERVLKDLRDLPPAVRGDAAKLKYWGLLEAEVDGVNEYDPTNPRSGYYRVTPNGLLFADRQIRVRESGWMYNGEFRLDHTSELISIDEALGRNFNYQELLSPNTGNSTHGQEE